MEEAVIANSVKVTQKKRDSNIELFRIITMILIVAHHFVVNSGLTAVGGPIYADPLSWKSLFLLLLGAWGKIGINCFVLITGYFMCTSHITLKKFLKLLCEIMFYRIIIQCIFWISGYDPFSWKTLIKVLIPVRTISTGFSSAYLVFFLFIPFLNILVNKMTAKQHIALLLLCGFLYVFLGTLPYFSVTMNYVSWFIVLYFISSFIRLHPRKIFDNRKSWLIMTIVFVLLSVISVVACAWLGTKLNRNMAFYFVTDSNTFLSVATGLSAFMLFKNINIKYNRFINAVASTTFGVLLIHASSDTMRRWLWTDLLHNLEMYSSAGWKMVLHAIGSVIAIFVVCSLIDYLRIRLIETPLFKLYDKIYDKFLPRWEAFDQKISERTEDK